MHKSIMFSSIIFSNRWPTGQMPWDSKVCATLLQQPLLSRMLLQLLKTGRGSRLYSKSFGARSPREDSRESAFFPASALRPGSGVSN